MHITQSEIGECDAFLLHHDAISFTSGCRQAGSRESRISNTSTSITSRCRIILPFGGDMGLFGSREPLKKDDRLKTRPLIDSYLLTVTLNGKVLDVLEKSHQPPSTHHTPPLS